MTLSPLLQTVLDLARWAPSGDNTQPWRFEPTGASSVRIHGRDTRDHCVYDLDGVPTLLSLGALVETLAIAASTQGHQLAWRLLPRPAPDRCVLEVTLTAAPGLAPSPLAAHITARSVQRRPLSTRPLSSEAQGQLQAVLSPGYRLTWFDTPHAKRRVAALLFANAHLRLTLPEAYPTHRDVIEWGARTSSDRIPDQSLGADPLTLRLMRWALQRWTRVQFMNRWLAGTWLPRLQMDLVPALACAGHVGILADQVPTEDHDHIEAGRQVQRLWLAMTRLGLQHQPEVTPLVFGRYVRQGTVFTSDPACQERARHLAARLSTTLGPDCARMVWLGRTGHGPAARARSLRKALPTLLGH